MIGRACSRCSAPSASTAHSMSWGPANARPASWASRASRRRTSVGGRGASPLERTSTTRPRRSSDARPAVRRPGHELVRPARDGGDDHPVVAPGQRVGAEQHAAPRGHEHRLHEHGHLGIDEAGPPCPVGRLVDLFDGGEQRGLAGDVEDRLEHARHRRRIAVLTGRRRAHDDRGGPVGRDRAPRRQRVVDRAARPRRREDGARERREPGGTRQRQVGSLRPDQRRIGGARVGERDHGRTSCCIPRHERRAALEDR